MNYNSHRFFYDQFILNSETHRKRLLAFKKRIDENQPFKNQSQTEWIDFQSYIKRLYDFYMMLENYEKSNGEEDDL